jgi:hypothetical protein
MTLRITELGAEVDVAKLQLHNIDVLMLQEPQLRP